MLPNFIPGKLLITVVGSHCAELVIEAMKQAGSTGGTLVSGRGLAAYRVPGGLPGLDAPEDIIFSVITCEPETIIGGLKQAADINPRELCGMVLVVDVPSFFLRPDLSPRRKNDDNDRGNEAMTSGRTLITSIINRGAADQVMATARQAGARGGTVVTARGTGTEEDVKFFGISLVPEKEMLLIIADDEDCRPIIQAISALPIFSEPGGGIVFTVGVEQFIVLGK